jgi:hypothetical protein
MNIDALHPFDFAECSLLFAVLYGISSLSARSTKEEEGGYRREEGQKQEARKLSSTTAFLGIIISFALAWVAPFVPEQFSRYWDAAPIVPAALLGIWWKYERRGSTVLDFEALATNINKQYEDAILESARELQLFNEPMLLTQENTLYAVAVARSSQEGGLLPDAVKRIIPSGAMLISVRTLEDVSRSFVFSRDRFDVIVADLRTRKVLPPRKEPPQPGSPES